MCGILFTNFKNLDDKTFKSALSKLNHRGPDFQKHIKLDNFYIGHTRLKILDLSDNSNQPYYSRNKRYVIIFNGEIYNYLELSKKYKIQLNYNSDTELLIELFVLKGVKIFNKLNGMFSFIIFDTHKNHYFVVRDRIGVKPLYVYQNDNEFIYSSEISPIKNLIQNLKLDNIALRQIKKFRNYYDNRTIYEQVKTFPPGHYFHNNYFYKYWDLEPNQSRFENENFNETLLSAINLRMISDVSVGSFLSGGIDSSLISVIANVDNTWSIGTSDNNEFNYVNLVAKKVNKKNYNKVYEKTNFLDDSKKILKSKLEPILVPNEVFIYSLSSDIKKENTVVLSGEGADELFFGYDRVFRWAINNNWNIDEFVDLYCYGDSKDVEIENDVMKKFNIFEENWLNISYFFQTSHLNGLLRRLDSSTMMHSIEGRSPFVDYRLIEMMFGIDPKIKINTVNSKIALKKFSENYLPNEIINRKKIGFPVNLYEIDGLKNYEGSNFFEKWINFNLEMLF